MKRLTKAEKEAACRIFREVNRITGDYYGRKTDKEIEGYCSLNRWIMFPNKDIESLAIGRSMPQPNVYISFDDEIRDDGAGHAQGWIGMTFNNGDAMWGLRGDIFRHTPKAVSFIQWLNGLGSDWYVELSQKLKVYSYKSVPRYNEFDTLDDTSIITQADIEDMIDRSDLEIKQAGDSDDDGVLVNGSVSTVNIARELTLRNSTVAIKEATDLLINTLSLYTGKP